MLLKNPGQFLKWRSRETVSSLCPIVVVSCLRDIKLLALQAQSIHVWLDKPHDIYILVNETHLIDQWQKEFDLHCRSWYQKHKLKIIYKEEFDCAWSKNPSLHWSGWEDQQILKLAIATKLDSGSYFVLDSQNFLINSWSTDRYTIADNRYPGRKNLYTMNKNTWEEYSKEFDLDSSIPDIPVMTISTPIYLRSDLVLSLIQRWTDLKGFTKWFSETSSSLSEFVLYYLWSEKCGGYDKFHYDVGYNNTWNGPMMRLKGNDTVAERSFSFFLSQFGKRKNESWVSITHRSWTLFSPTELKDLSNLLKTRNLDLE